MKNNSVVDFFKKVVVIASVPFVMGSCANSNDNDQTIAKQEPSGKFELLADSVIQMTMSTNDIEMRGVTSISGDKAKRFAKGVKIYDFRQAYQTELTMINSFGKQDSYQSTGYSFIQPLNENKPEVKVAKDKMESLMRLKPQPRGF